MFRIFVMILGLFIITSPLIYGDPGKLARQAVGEIQSGNLDGLSSTFEALEESFEASADMIAEAREFLEEFIAEMNARYSVHLTLPQVCEIAKRNLDLFQIPKGFDYSKVVGIRTEARQKLIRFTPENLGQASRISGVTPSDISVLMIALKKKGDSCPNT